MANNSVHFPLPLWGEATKSSEVIKSFLSFCSRESLPFNLCPRALLPSVNLVGRLKENITKVRLKSSLVRTTVSLILF